MCVLILHALMNAGVCGTLIVLVVVLLSMQDDLVKCVQKFDVLVVSPHTIIMFSESKSF